MQKTAKHKRVWYILLLSFFIFVNQNILRLSHQVLTVVVAWLYHGCSMVVAGCRTSVGMRLARIISSGPVWNPALYLWEVCPALFEKLHTQTGWPTQDLNHSKLSVKRVAVAKEGAKGRGSRLHAVRSKNQLSALLSVSRKVLGVRWLSVVQSRKRADRQSVSSGNDYLSYSQDRKWLSLHLLFSK